MKKIGTTLNETVIVEMTLDEFEALGRSQAPTSGPVRGTGSAALTPSQRVEYVRERIAKLKPKTKDGVARSIRSMFQFNGGIDDRHVEEVIAALQKEKFLRIDADEKVTYKYAKQIGAGERQASPK
jgi:hypothetical protein